MSSRATDLCLRSQLYELGEQLRRVLDASIRVRVVVADDCPDCAAAGDALRAALIELVANARDAMSGVGTLTVQAGPCSEALRACPFDAATAQRWVAVSVADTGCGMTVVEREHAADPGFTTKPSPRGGGWGLTRAAGFARAAGGTLGIGVAPGGGTVVTLYLPA